MPTKASLADLDVSQRNELEMMLMDFDAAWTPKLINEFANRLRQDERRGFRFAAMTELVKTDLQRSWAGGKGRKVEDYLALFPSLGTKDTVDCELIFVEYAARIEIQPETQLQNYQSRFPQQYAALVDLAKAHVDSASGSSVDGAVASMDTSQSKQARDTRVAGQSRETTKELPVEFGRYRILRELGSGAMGKVYLAHDSQLDRQVALKTPRFKDGINDELISRFYREARSAAKIQHRNICPVFDVGEIDGRHFLSMAFVRGRCMSEFIRPKKLPPPRTSALLIRRLALALAEAHRHNVIHRDLKPANIMIDLQREPVVMDFGLARQTDVESRMTQTGMAVGTPAYMSPEQVRGELDNVGPPSDIYSLGVIFYEILTGQLPFRGSIAQVVYKVVNEDPTPVNLVRPELDDQLVAITSKMMAKEISHRYQSMEQVADVLKLYLRGQFVGESNVPAPPPVPSQPQPRTDSNELYEFFAGETIPGPGQTLVEVHQPKVRRSKALRNWLAIAIGILLVVSGIAFLIETPNGSVRVTTYGDLDGLEVLVDGNVIELEQSLPIDTEEHQLGLRVKGKEIPFDESANQFIVTNHGGRQRIAIMLNDIELTGKRFTVVRGKEAALKIELVRGTRQAIVGRSDNEDFAPLFNGRDLDGWTVRGERGWTVRDGTLEGRTLVGLGWLMSAEEYEDFDLEFEYWLGSGSNSGVFLRAWADGEINGAEFHEIQIIDDHAAKHASVKPNHRTGSLHGELASQMRESPLPNRWHRMRIRLVDQALQVWVNGEIVTEGKVPSGKPTRGHIGLQLYPDHVRFRDIRIRRLDPDESQGFFGSVSSDWDDLLSGVVLSRDAVDGGFLRQGTSLRTPPWDARNTDASRLKIPYGELPAEYDLRMIVERKSDRGFGINIVFDVDGNQTAIATDAGENPKWGLTMIDGKTLRINPSSVSGKRLRVDERSEILVEVRQRGVTLRHNGIVVSTWNGAPDRLSLWNHLKIPGWSGLSIGSQAEFVVHRFEIRAVKDR